MCGSNRSECVVNPKTMRRSCTRQSAGPTVGTPKLNVDDVPANFRFSTDGIVVIGNNCDQWESSLDSGDDHGRFFICFEFRCELRMKTVAKCIMCSDFFSLWPC